MSAEYTAEINFHTQRLVDGESAMESMHELLRLTELGTWEAFREARTLDAMFDYMHEEEFATIWEDLDRRLMRMYEDSTWELRYAEAMANEKRRQELEEEEAAERMAEEQRRCAEMLRSPPPCSEMLQSPRRTNCHVRPHHIFRSIPLSTRMEQFKYDTSDDVTLDTSST